jgi:UDPglucose 6-dehydrogenase
MAMIAAKCPHIQVTVCDFNAAWRIDAWNSDNLPVYEPGLESTMSCASAPRHRNLHFTTDIRPPSPPRT